ncbi:MAG: 16S rRNA (guanine(966)-N(2))-methyltransferase RsmD [Verrucomicrobiota bacterium]
MRITSGVLRNRRFSVPKQEVRPTKEQVREAMFSSLGGSCEGMKVLDLFAGAGSLGLEAWSRGAESVFFVEQNPNVWKNLQENIQSLSDDGLGTAKCIKDDAIRFLERVGEQFDLILADPPYDLPDAMAQTLAKIAGHSVLTPDGILVYELRSSDAFEISSDWRLLRDKVYGDTRVLMLKLNNEDIL